MIDFNVNYLAVLVVGIVNMILGALWYGPIFGKKWIKLMNFTKDDISKAKQKGMTKSYLLGFLVSLITSWVIALLINLGTHTLSFGVAVGFLVWFGFVATTSLNGVLWGGQKFGLYVLNNGYSIIGYILMGLILSIWV